MDCEKFSSALKFPIIPCDLCGSQDGLQRQQVKKLLNEWESRTPGRRQIMFRSLMNARPSHLLDKDLFDFASLQINSYFFTRSIFTKIGIKHIIICIK